MSEEKKKTAREIIEGYDGPPVRIMEVCGTHTHEIFRLGIRKLLPKQVELISGRDVRFVSHRLASLMRPFIWRWNAA